MARAQREEVEELVWRKVRARESKGSKGTPITPSPAPRAGSVLPVSHRHHWQRLADLTPIKCLMDIIEPDKQHRHWGGVD
jgi:hypothetical protein